MPKLVAKERFFYAGRNVEKDEEFEAEVQDVDLLIHSSSPRARLPDAVVHSKATPMQTRSMSPMSFAERGDQANRSDQVRPRRYNRRDMQPKE